MKQIKKLKCQLYGHEPYYIRQDLHECLNCERSLSYYELTQPGYLSKIQNYFLMNFELVDYFSKCKDCGLRFNMHNSKVDHVPF